MDGNIPRVPSSHLRNWGMPVAKEGLGKVRKQLQKSTEERQNF